MISAKVIATTTVNNQPTKIGDIVEVDENTFRNLALKGRLELAEKPNGKKEDPETDETAGGGGEPKGKKAK